MRATRPREVTPGLVIVEGAPWGVPPSHKADTPHHPAPFVHPAFYVAQGTAGRPHAVAPYAGT